MDSRTYDSLLYEMERKNKYSKSIEDYLTYMAQHFPQNENKEDNFKLYRKSQLLINTNEGSSGITLNTSYSCSSPAMMEEFCKNYAEWQPQIKSKNTELIICEKDILRVLNIIMILFQQIKKNEAWKQFLEKFPSEKMEQVSNWAACMHTYNLASNCYTVKKITEEGKFNLFKILLIQIGNSPLPLEKQQTELTNTIALLETQKRKSADSRLEGRTPKSEPVVRKKSNPIPKLISFFGSRSMGSIPLTLPSKRSTSSTPSLTRTSPN